MAGEGALLGVVTLLGGGLLDNFAIDPFFQQLEAGTSFTGWNPTTAFLFLHAIPFAASVAIVAAVIGAILRR